MNVFQGVSIGIKAYGRAAGILFSREFRWFLIFPFLLLILLFTAGEIAVSSAGSGLSEFLQTKIEAGISGIPWLDWMHHTAGIIIKVLLKIAYFFLFITFGGYFLLIVMSPVFSHLSEKVEEHLTGNKYPFSLRRMLREIIRGILIAFRNMFLQLCISLLLFICSFIPVIGLLSPLALFFVSAYFYGFSFVDYVVERRYLKVKNSVRYVNKNIGIVIGIGMVFALSLTIPWLNIIACGFVALLSVIAATVAINDEKKKQILN